ncbi:hypothetical protein K443DRAFT_15896 [Laccaria amethystina LaAM-08-1]|uniref:Uncharacterized protein n=1 Tax=Laccaria amethystina LaAM-08-1 TaxID=1095629 RepID=A0A0C9WGL7_9AGAR|nr:hypothetical protein K443DRAFT_15896 [Laccaria amethystina LaAM-08-1]
MPKPHYYTITPDRSSVLLTFTRLLPPILFQTMLLFQNSYLLVNIKDLPPTDTMSGTYVESSHTEEHKDLALCPNLPVPIAYPSISQPINTNPPTLPPVQKLLNSFYASPSCTSGMATIQPPEQVRTI